MSVGGGPLGSSRYYCWLPGREAQPNASFALFELSRSSSLPLTLSISSAFFFLPCPRSFLGLRPSVSLRMHFSLVYPNYQPQPPFVAGVAACRAVLRSMLNKTLSPLQKRDEEKKVEQKEKKTKRTGEKKYNKNTDQERRTIIRNSITYTPIFLSSRRAGSPGRLRCSFC